MCLPTYAAAGGGEARRLGRTGEPVPVVWRESEFMGSVDEGNVVRWYTEVPMGPGGGVLGGDRRTGPAPAQSVLPHDCGGQSSSLGLRLGHRQTHPPRRPWAGDCRHWQGSQARSQTGAVGCDQCRDWWGQPGEVGAVVRAPHSSGVWVDSGVVGGWGRKGTSRGNNLLFTGKPHTSHLLGLWTCLLFPGNRTFGRTRVDGEGPQVDTQICSRYPACPKWAPPPHCPGPLCCAAHPYP